MNERLHTLAMVVLVMLYMTVMNCGIQRHLYVMEEKQCERKALESK